MSKVNNKFTFSEDIWVISLLNTGEKFSGHSVIVVEGMATENALSINHCDIRASLNENKSGLPYISNTTGIITEICHFKGYKYTEERYDACSAYTWYVYPAKAKQMMIAIEKEQEELRGKILELKKVNPVNSYADLEKICPKYQLSGRYRFKLFGSNEGDNCVTWCLEKLAIALPKEVNKARFSGFVKKMPQGAIKKATGGLRKEVIPHFEAERQLRARL